MTRSVQMQSRICSPTFLSALVVRITAEQVRPMLKRESFPIAKIYVPVKRGATIRPEAAREIAESMLEIGQETPMVSTPRLASSKSSNQPLQFREKVAKEVANNVAIIRW